MHAMSLVVCRESLARVPEQLRLQRIVASPHEPINEFQVLRCEREGVGALLGISQPAHWAAASDERRDLVVLAAMSQSLFRFWRIPREQRLAREIIDLLRPLAWKAPATRW
jgi:hypothetical protein